MQTELREWISPQELADWLGLGDVKAVDRWHDSQAAPPRYKIGRVTRYRRAEVEAWLEARRVDTGQPARYGRPLT